MLPGGSNIPIPILIGAEILARLIKLNSNIMGIKFWDIEFKFSPLWEHMISNTKCQGQRWLIGQD